MKIIIVDENDQVIGAKERAHVDRDGDIYRSSALWIVNSQGKALLAQRALTKSHHPGKWGPAAAGTVEQGETYRENIEKEVVEELGIKGLTFIEGSKHKIEGEFNHFTQWFVAAWDGELTDLTLQENEVDDARWVSKEELDAIVANDNPDVLDSLKKQIPELQEKGNKL